MDNADVQRYLERAAVTEYLLNINPQLDKELNASTSGNTAVDANKTTQLMSQKNLLTVNSGNR